MSHEPRSAEQRVSLRGAAFTLTLAAVTAIGLAGLPAAPEESPRATVVARRDASLPCQRALEASLADLMVPVDARTLQRPVYPGVAELEGRLLAIPGWKSAVLFSVDASAEELHARGFADRGLCESLHPEPVPDPLGGLSHWRLLLVDEHGQTVGTTVLCAPVVEREHREPGRVAPLEARFPGWPRVTVFRRPADVQRAG